MSFNDHHCDCFETHLKKLVQDDAPQAWWLHDQCCLSISFFFSKLSAKVELDVRHRRSLKHDRSFCERLIKLVDKYWRSRKSLLNCYVFHSHQRWRCRFNAHQLIKCSIRKRKTYDLRDWLKNFRKDSSFIFVLTRNKHILKFSNSSRSFSHI